MNEMSLGAILATGSSGSFAAGSASVSVTRSDNPAAKPGNVSCAHVAARRRVLDERQGMAARAARHTWQERRLPRKLSFDCAAQ